MLLFTPVTRRLLTLRTLHPLTDPGRRSRKQPVNKLLQRLFLTATCLLPIGIAAAEAPPTNVTLDLRMPELQSVSPADPITVPEESQDPEDISVVGVSLPDGTSDLEISRAGLGSLYWAARRPAARAWRVMLPITPDEAPIVYEHLRVECALARPLANQGGCP